MHNLQQTVETNELVHRPSVQLQQSRVLLNMQQVQECGHLKAVT